MKTETRRPARTLVLLLALAQLAPLLLAAPAHAGIALDQVIAEQQIKKDFGGYPVRVVGPTDGQVLRFNGTTKLWEAGSSSGPTTSTWAQVLVNGNTTPGTGAANPTISNGDALLFGSDLRLQRTGAAALALDNAAGGSASLSLRTLIGPSAAPITITTTTGQDIQIFPSNATGWDSLVQLTASGAVNVLGGDGTVGTNDGGATVVRGGNAVGIDRNAGNLLLGSGRPTGAGTSAISFQTTPSGASSSTLGTARTIVTFTGAGNVVLNATGSALLTTATDGFTYLPSCAGTPTGVPTSFTGAAPLVVDSTNNLLYFLSGGSWRALNPSGGSSLQAAYDGGPNVTTTGASTWTNNAANNNSILAVVKNPAGAQAGNGFSVTMGANATGFGVNVSTSATSISAAGINVTNTGDGTGILSAGGGSGISLTATSASSGSPAAFVQAGTGAATLQLTNTGVNNSGVLVVAKSPAAPQSGDGATVSMSANTTGHALSITQLGTGNTIVAANAALPASIPSSLAWFGTNSATPYRIFSCSSAGVDFDMPLILYRSRGTLAAQTSAADGDWAGRIGGQILGSDNSSTTVVGEVGFRVQGTVGAGTAGGRIVYRTTPAGLGTLAARFTMDNAGALVGAPDAIYAWTNTAADPTAAVTTNLSQASAGVLQVGTSTAGSAGTILASSFGFTSLIDWTSGTGSPESAVTASVGALYSRTNGSAGTTLYIKESGTNSNTGWVAVASSTFTGGTLTSAINWNTGGAYTQSAPQLLGNTDGDFFVSAGTQASGAGRGLTLSASPAVGAGNTGGTVTISGRNGIGNNALDGSVLINSGAGGGASAQAQLNLYGAGTTGAVKAGKGFDLHASSTSSGTDTGALAGSTLSSITASLGTGNGRPGDMALRTGYPLASGSSQQGVTDRLFLAGLTKSLADNTATTFAQVALATNNSSVGGMVTYTVRVTDSAGDEQCTSGAFYFSATNKAGTVTVTSGNVGTAVQNLVTGTDTVTISTSVTGTNVNLRVTSDTSLTQVVHEITYSVTLNGGPATCTPQ